MNAQTMNKTLDDLRDKHGGISGRMHLSSNGGADNSALTIGSGTSTSPATTDTANKNFLEFRTESTATDASSDTRCAYLRLYLEGETTGGGDCLRAFTTVNENVGTAHGAHISLNFEAAAGGSECSGLGAAARATLHIPDVASWAPTGTLAAGVFEIYSDGDESDPAGLAELSVLRLCNSGDSTGAADVDDDANILSIQGFTAAADATSAVSSVSLAELPTGTVGLKCLVGSTAYYIPAVVSTEWN